MKYRKTKQKRNQLVDTESQVLAAGWARGWGLGFQRYGPGRWGVVKIAPSCNRSAGNEATPDPADVSLLPSRAG